MSDFDRMDRWILIKLSLAIRTSNEALEQYNFQEVTTAIYNFWLYDLCDVYLVRIQDGLQLFVGNIKILIPIHYL